MSAAVENIQGYVPITDGRRFVRPEDTRDAEKNRYLTFVGNMIDPESARQRTHLRVGGIEVENHCLRYVKHFLRQGRITPLLEDQFDPVAPETVDPQDKSFYKVLPPPGYVAPSGAEGAPAAVMPPLVSKRVLPGDQIDLIISGEHNIHRNQPRGIVELRSLKGWDYNVQDLGEGLFLDPEIWKLQRAIFPTYPMMPTLIVEIRRLLDEAWEHTYLRDIVEDFQKSSEQFETYARTTVEQAHLNMNTVAAAAGYALTYTPVDLVLLGQLGMKRRDREFQMTADMIGQSAASNDMKDMKEMFAMMLQSSREEREAMVEMFKASQNAKASISADTMAEAPIRTDFATETVTNATPAGQEQIAEAIADTVHTCDCGESFPKAQGLSMHQRRWCKLRASAETEVGEQQ